KKLYLQYYKKAIYYFKKYPPFAASIQISNIYHNLSIYYSRTANLKMQLYYLNKSFEVLRGSNESNELLISGLLISKGVYCTRVKKYKHALSCFRKSLKIRKHKLGINNLLLFTNYFQIA